jgi:hypothetical protein
VRPCGIDLNINGLPSPNYKARTLMDGMFKRVNVRGRPMARAEDGFEDR